MNFNTTLKEKREKEFGVKYACPCKFQCSFFNVELPDCDCEYCGTRPRDEYRNEKDESYIAKQYA